MAQVPKYTAQLRDQIKFKRSQAFLGAMISTALPPLAVFLLVEDERLMEEIFKPIGPFFLIYAAAVWGITLLYVLLLTLKIMSLTDSSENQS